MSLTFCDTFWTFSRLLNELTRSRNVPFSVPASFSAPASTGEARPRAARILISNAPSPNLPSEGRNRSPTMGMDLARRLTNPGLLPFWKEVEAPAPEGGLPPFVSVVTDADGASLLSSVILGAAVSPVSTESSALPASAPLPIGQRAELRKVRISSKPDSSTGPRLITHTDWPFEGRRGGKPDPALPKISAVIALFRR